MKLKSSTSGSFKFFWIDLDRPTRSICLLLFRRLTQQTILLRACLHEGGGPQVGEVTRGGLPHLTCKRDHIKMRDYMDRWVTLPKWVTSPSWGPPPPRKQTLTLGRHCLVPEASCRSTRSMRLGSRGPSEEVVSFSFTTKYNSFFWPYK